MRPSELFSGSAHVPVALGLAPPLSLLEATLDGETQDTSISLWPAEEGDASSVWRHKKVQAVVLQFWDLCKKEEDSTILAAAYDSLVLRFLRIYLPGLAQEAESSLCANSWQEAARGGDRMDLAKFFQGLVRIAQSWCDSNTADDYAVFLEDLLYRSSCFRITDPETGEVRDEQPPLRVSFRPVERGDDMMAGGTCEFSECMDLVCSGTPESVKVEVKFDQGQLGINFHTSYFQETAVASPSAEGAAQRVWAPLEAVRPLGYAVIKVFDALRAVPPFTLSCEGKKGELPHVVVETMQEATRGSQAVLEVSSQGAVCILGGSAFDLRALVGPVANEGIASGSFVLNPERTSLLYKLTDLRRSLLLDQCDSRLAAASLGVEKAPVELPTFPDLLAGRLAVEPGSKRAQTVKKESLLASGSLTSLADACLVQRVLKPAALPVAADEPKPAVTAEAIYEAFTAHFPKDPDGLCNDDADILSLARTPPVVLWVFGQCDLSGEYKTEVCRRLAQKLQLQWLQPSYVLELAVRTPPSQRSALAKRCVEQLQRGMTIQMADALRLTLEMMSSALCKANGYILDFPPVGPEEVTEVSEFFEKVKALSSAPEVTLEEVLKDEVVLEPLAPEPEPPKPPPEEGAGDAEGGEGVAPEGEAEASPEGEAPADAPADAEAADGAPAEGAGEEGAAEEEPKEPPPPPPPPPPVQNPWASALPRRLVVLSMDSDEVGGWRLETLKLKHEEKARIRRELEEAGEEVPEEEEEEPEELPQMPEEEEEQKALFDKTAGDVLQTMAPFHRPPPLEPPKTLPPLPDESQQEEPETVDRQALQQGEQQCIQAIRKASPLPLLALRMDGRPPAEAADLLEVTTAPSLGLRVPLPAPIEGAGEEPKELLRLNLEDKQQSRRWSPWRLHCPVALHEKRLIPGSNEFAVDYAGYVFLCSGEEQMRHFCQWPKRYLTEAPRINAPGLVLGFGLLSPCGYRAAELAKRAQSIYGFDVVDVVSLLERAMKQPPMPEPPFHQGEEEADPPPMPAPGEPYLIPAEHADLLAGKAVSLATSVRLIGWALGIDMNISLIQQQAQAVEDAKKALEEAQAAGNEPPEDITLDDEGQPVVPLKEPLHTPSKGFILQGFPESAEQMEALQKQLGLALEQVLVLKPGGEEPPEVADILTKEGYAERLPLGPLLESQLANFEALAGVDGLRLAEVALQVTEEEQFVQVRKHIDPFYEVVEDPAMAAEIPDPDEWTPEEVDPEVDAEPQEPPVIPWGSCGSYCPVTLKEQRWLYPGQKDFQHVYRNSVFAMASEAASEAFQREPVRYVPVDEEPVLPPPRLMVTGPTGSGVAKQCELLSQVYKVPVLNLEEIWKAKTRARLDKVLEAKHAAAKLESLQQPMVEDGNVSYPEGWVPPEEKPPGDEDEEAAEEDAVPEPEDDGLDDEQREELFVQAMKDALGPHCGACIVDATWFGDLEQEEMSDEMRAARSLQNLLTKAQRIPDLTVILKCKHDLAAKNTFDFASIDREYEERLAAYKAEVAAAEAKEEDPPEPPEGLVLDEESEEKESDRVKARFIETKKAQQGALQELAEALTAARAPIQKVPSDRGDGPTHKAIRWHCRPFVEKRRSLLLKQQVTKVSPSKASDLLARGLVRVSRFGQSNPLLQDSASLRPPGAELRPAAVLRSRLFFPPSDAELAQFLENPGDFLTASGPSLVGVAPAIAVLGAPLSGKTTLARALSERTGAVCISVASLLGELIAPGALPSQLSKDVAKALGSGKEVPTDLVVSALRKRLVSADCLRLGWILDDFPCTAAQAEALTHAGIVPHRVLMLDATEAVIFNRTRALNAAGGESGGALLQQELALQKERLSSFRSLSPALRVFYALTFENVRDIDGARSTWAVFDQAMQETTQSVSQRLTYYRQTALGGATRIVGMGFTASRLQKSASNWKHYCPVTLSLSNELVASTDLRFAVEYKSKVYWLATDEYATLFCEDPEAFLEVPLPKLLPKLLDDAERMRKASFPVELEEFCPVALVEKGELVKANGYHIVEYNSNLYSFSSREAAKKFLRRPARYLARAKLPRKRPPEVSKSDRQNAQLLSALVKGKDGRGLAPADMVTYMQASVAELICQGLVVAGEKRPLFPGKGPEESALLFLARFLRARNPLNTETYAETVRQSREEFLSNCALPSDLKEMTEKKLSPDHAWTSSDTAKFEELCARFDEVFPPQR